MTTPPLLSGLPSDKLVPPLNAPRAGNVATGVQPGVSGQVVLAQYVIVFGSTGGVFVYDGIPGLGNPPLYWFGNVTQDPYKNALDQGIWAGQPGSIQVGIQTNSVGPSGTAQVFFVPAGAYAADASIGIIQQAGQAILEILGVQTAAVPAAASDRVAMFMWDHGAGTSAALQGFYYDSNGAAHELYSGTFAGLGLPIASVLAIQPGTGTSTTNPAQSEVWHPITLDAGWTVVETPQYRLLPDGNVQVMGQISHAATTSAVNINNGAPIPSAYWPAANRYYRPPDAADTAGPVQISSTGVFAMRAAGFSATQAILDGIYGR